MLSYMESLALVLHYCGIEDRLNTAHAVFFQRQFTHNRGMPFYRQQITVLRQLANINY